MKTASRWTLRKIIEALKRGDAIVAWMVLALWFCAAVDVFIYMPKRAWYATERRALSGREKLYELWGGLYTASEGLKAKNSLGAKVGVPTREYDLAHNFTAEYDHPNYRALAYPGRPVAIESAEDLFRKEPAYLILEEEWPEFSFPGDPRRPGHPAVERPTLVRVRYDG